MGRPGARPSAPRASSVDRSIATVLVGFAYGVLLFGDRVTAMAIAGMLLIAVAGLSATLLRSRNPGIAAIADPRNTV